MVLTILCTAGQEHVLPEGQERRLPARVPRSGPGVWVMYVFVFVHSVLLSSEIYISYDYSRKAEFRVCIMNSFSRIFTFIMIAESCSSESEASTTGAPRGQRPSVQSRPNTLLTLHIDLQMAFQISE